MSVVTRIRKSEELTLPFTAEEVWRVLADVVAYPRWWPATRGLRILNSPPGPLGTEFEVRHLMGRAFCCRLEELERPSNLRIRFFGGELEGPGGFHLKPRDNSTQVRYHIDLFARGLDVAVLSRMVPLDRIYGLRMRRVLRNLGKRLISRRKEIARVTALPAPEEVIAKLSAEEAGLALEPRAKASPGPSAASRRIRSLMSGLAAWLRESPGGKADPVPVGETAGVSVQGPTSDFGIARSYLHALSTDAAAEDLVAFFQPEALDEEFPNPMLPTGATRDLGALLNARSLSREKWSSQTFELRGATSGGSQVALEIHWAGTSTGDTHLHVAGQQARARLAVFLKFHDHRIVRQRTYISLVSAVGGPEGPLGHARPRQTGEGSRIPGPHLSGPAASNFEIARLYLGALSSGQGTEEIAPFFAPDAIQEEFPNRFEATGARRGREAIAQARERDLAFLDSEDYDLLGAHGGGSKVAMEVHWTGVVAANHAPFVAGQKLELRSAIFLKFRDGLIVRERRYDCIWPLGVGPPDLGGEADRAIIDADGPGGGSS